MIISTEFQKLLTVHIRKNVHGDGDRTLPSAPLIFVLFFLDFFVFLWEGEKGVCKKKNDESHERIFVLDSKVKLWKGVASESGCRKKFSAGCEGAETPKLWKFREKWEFWRLMSKVLINFWRFFLSKFSKNFSPLFFAKTLKFYIFMTFYTV